MAFPTSPAEGTNINLQLAPQGVNYTTSVTVSPAGSGLVFSSGYLLQGTLTDVGADTEYTVTVIRANAFGSSTGTFKIIATDETPVTTNDTPWNYALDFSGSSERAAQVTTSHGSIPMKMNNYGSTATSNSNSSKTSSASTAMPWATAIVFKADGHNSNQHIWNVGEGSGSTDDNIYLRLSASRGLYFGWGRGSSNNECLIHNDLPLTQWFGIYVAHKGGRFGASNATAANLADAFDIRITSDGDWTTMIQKSTVANWITTGNRMDRSIGGELTIGGRGSNRSFHGKVASFVSTTLLKGVDVPSDAEVNAMITDPTKWLNTYKVGQQWRAPNSNYVNTNFQLGNTSATYHCQVWLMGDGTNDNYSNMIRNQVNPIDQNFTKLNLISMVSNDIQNVNISGLTE